MGGKPEVFTNRTISLKNIRQNQYSHIILSAGPGSVENPDDFGICAEAITAFAGKIPILGICLGHQGIAYQHGGKIIKAQQPVHGKKSWIYLQNTHPLFLGLPDKIEVMRYHSLVVDRFALPENLEIIAETDDYEKVIMALSHKQKKLFGLQFHPESIGTILGKKILQNFLMQ